MILKNYRKDDADGEVQANSVQWVPFLQLTKETTFASHYSIIYRAAKMVNDAEDRKKNIAASMIGFAMAVLVVACMWSRIE